MEGSSCHDQLQFLVLSFPCIDTTTITSLRRVSSRYIDPGFRGGFRASSGFGFCGAGYSWVLFSARGSETGYRCMADGLCGYAIICFDHVDFVKDS